MDCNKIKFEDEFEADDEICDICGNETMPRVGYNEKKDLLSKKLYDAISREES